MLLADDVEHGRLLELHAESLVERKVADVGAEFANFFDISALLP